MRGSIFVEEVEPLEDEAKSIKEYEKRKRAGDVEFSALSCSNTTILFRCWI